MFEKSPNIFLKTYRFVQGNFSVSKKGTCINPFFTIKPLSRETTALSAGCGRLSRTLPKVYVSCEFYLLKKNSLKIVLVARVHGIQTKLRELPSSNEHPPFRTMRQRQRNFSSVFQFSNEVDYSSCTREKMPFERGRLHNGQFNACP